MAPVANSIRGVVLAGGYPRGQTAFDQLLPRPLVPVAHKPLIWFAVSWLWDAGITSVTVCGNRETRALQAQLGRHVPIGMTWAYREDPMPRGAAGCLRDAADADPCDAYVVIDASVVPASLDVSTVLEQHRDTRAAITTVVFAEPAKNGAGHGAVSPVGVYVVNGSALESVPTRGFVDIKEHLIPRLYRAGARVMAYYASCAVPRVMNAQTYLTINGMATAALVSSSAVPPGYSRRGDALVHAGASVAADAVLAGPLLIGEGAEIGAGAVVIGPTSIGCDVVVQTGALVSRSAVWRRSFVPAGAVVDRCVLGDGAVIQANGHRSRAAPPARPETNAS